MNCPKCGYEMSTESSEEASGSYSGKPIKRIKYSCSTDGAKVIAEIPNDEPAKE